MIYRHLYPNFGALSRHTYYPEPTSYRLSPFLHHCQPVAFAIHPIVVIWYGIKAVAVIGNGHLNMPVNPLELHLNIMRAGMLPNISQCFLGDAQQLQFRNR